MATNRLRVRHTALGLSTLSEHRPSERDNRNMASDCVERNRFLEAFVMAVREYLQIESGRVAAIRRGEDLSFRAKIEGARKRKEEAKRAVRKHQQEHGC